MSFFFFQAEDGIRDVAVTGVQTCALPILVEMMKRSNLDYGIVVRKIGGGTGAGMEEQALAMFSGMTGQPGAGKAVLLAYKVYPDGREEMIRGAHLSGLTAEDRKSTRLNSSHGYISYAVFC